MSACQPPICSDYKARNRPQLTILFNNSSLSTKINLSPCHLYIMTFYEIDDNVFKYFLAKNMNDVFFLNDKI